MSRNRIRTQQFEHAVRASPVHWSEQSDDSSDQDQDEADGVGRTPRRVETQEYEAEDLEADIDCKVQRSHYRNQYHEASRSPVLNRRPINRHGAAIKEYTNSRGTKESYYPEHYVSKFQSDRQPKCDDDYELMFHERENFIKARKSPGPSKQTSIEARKSPMPAKSIKYDNIPWILMMLFVIIVFSYLFISSPEENNYTSKQDMTTEVKNALSEFENIPEDSVIQFSAGIRSIVESDPTKPSIFVLLHNNTGDGPFNLAVAIGNVAMKYLESDEEGPLILNPNEMLQNKNMSKDYGWIIEHYKPHIEKHRSVVVTDLQKFPGRMAMAFHFLCDTYSPVVPKSLFLFTLHTENVYTKKVVEQAENVMHNIWRHDVDNDQRQALITRLTEDVISLPLNILHSK